jgi:hypothetical protein
MPAKSVTEQDVTLCDLLDRLLYTGVVVKGDVTISVADVDLVYLQLNLLLTSVAKITDICQERESQQRITMVNQP